ncbi:YciI family protein [Kitasatospora sp. RB6PN24]|uniref:YciI family protein n=1 Tax=Kitasatospora humi TaxID=2893891 RepID=UPI001E451F2B|nr:YciI family protein [Kitasatospora humi]MCC9310341.1 YciI family protein [Kitasatospora humi]
MAYYAVEYVFSPDKRHLRVRPTHREYLAGLAEAGRIVLCGPLTSDTGGLLIFRAEDEAEVRTMVDHDPYTTAGVLSRVRIEQWSPVLGYLAPRL